MLEAINMTIKPKRLLTFKRLKPERGWPYSRQHTYRLIKEGRFPRPKKFPGSAINFWTDDQIDDHYSTLEGDDNPSNKPKAGCLKEA